jgi:hypothetical protein
MAYKLQTRLEHAGSRLDEVDSEEVIYSRSGVASTCVWNACVARIAEDDPTFATVPLELLRKLVKFTGYASELILAGVEILPKQGDLLVRPNGDRYQIVSPASAPEVYRYITVSKTRIELYAQKVPVAGVVDL